MRFFRSRAGLLLFLYALCALAVRADEPAPEDLLATLLTGHPRLLLTTADETLLRERARTDPLLAELIDSARAEATQILAEPPVVHELLPRDHLLVPARRVLRNVTLCALFWRLDGDPRFGARALAELESAASWPEWTPWHFLANAELATAFAIGYDWLQPLMDEAQRERLAAVMAERVLRAGLPATAKNPKHLWWRRSPINWNTVCNAGVTLAALALAEREPDLARAVVAETLASLPRAFAPYQPEGAYPEGPAYWGYGTNYLLVCLHAFRTALGNDFGLAESAGALRASGDYRLAMTGTSGLLFNYGDSAPVDRLEPALFGLARLYELPALAARTRSLLATDIATRRAELSGASPVPDFRAQEQRYRWLQILWYASAEDLPAPSPTTPPPPLAQVFRGQVELLTARTAWDDKEAAFLGFKAGDNRASHTHLDLGSFVYDALGLRWAADLGPDSYALPDYFKAPLRWTYFRNGSASHNTLLIDGRGQAPEAAAHLVAKQISPGRTHAVADLSAAYADRASSVRRGVALLADGSLLVQDEITGLAPGAEVRWAMLTPATLQLDGASATLGQQDHRLHARVLSPAAAVFAMEPAQPATEAETPNPGYSLLTVRVHAPAEATSPLTLTVLLSPRPVTSPPPAAPLAEWANTP